MNIMKKLFCTIAVIMVFGIGANAQERVISANPVSDLKVKTIKNNLELTWQGIENEGSKSYWQVEASADGKGFSTIGYVWGSENGNCKFRQNAEKIKKGLIYYRVLVINEAGTATVSHIIKL